MLASEMQQTAASAVAATHTHQPVLHSTTAVLWHCCSTPTGISKASQRRHSCWYAHFQCTATAAGFLEKTQPRITCKLCCSAVGGAAHAAAQ
jgi:hypothetical protein